MNSSAGLLNVTQGGFHQTPTPRCYGIMLTAKYPKALPYPTSLSVIYLPILPR